MLKSGVMGAASVSANKKAPSPDGGVVVHFGVGNFHRAHQARCIAHANRAAGVDWRIWGVCPRQPAARDRLRRQNWRYHLLVEDRDGAQLEEISVHDSILVAPENPRAVVGALASPLATMATFTVTEKGYFAAEAAEPPAGVFHLVAKGLEQRRKGGLDGITLLSCDNLPENGGALRNALFRAIRPRPALADWVEKRCAFPSSMVDGIVPRAGDQLRRRLREEFGVEDEWPVQAEKFSQWVVENRFAGPRPPLERGGAEIVDNAAPYERVKLGMLNGAHSLLAYAGLRRGARLVRDAVNNRELTKKMESYWGEAEAAMSPPAGFDLRAHRARLRERFANPALAHRLEQIAEDGSQKIAARWLPLLRTRADTGMQSPVLCDAVAEWIAYCAQKIADAEPLDDPLADALARALREGPERVLSMGAVFGDLFVRHPGLATDIARRVREKH